MSTPITIEESRREREKQRLLFVSSGLRPLQVVLCICFLAYVISVVSEVSYYWSQTHIMRPIFSVVLPGLVWFLHFQYRRTAFLLLALVMAGSLTASLGHLAADGFRVVGSLAQAMVVVIALIIYAKMKPLILSKSDGA